MAKVIYVYTPESWDSLVEALFTIKKVFEKAAYIREE